MMDTSRLVCLLRAKWHLQIAQRQVATAHFEGSSLAESQFVSRPLSEHLVLVCAYDYDDRYEYLDASELDGMGLNPSVAMEVAWRNTLKRAGQDLSFEKMPEFGWIPSTAGTDECVALLAAVDSIRSLPVAGRHLAFAPNSRGFWITGTDNPTGISLLCAIVLHEYENAEGKPLTPIPMVLGDDGQWHSWLPLPEHPSYWEVRGLHARFAHEIYEEQRTFLRQQGASSPDDAFVAAHFLHTYGGEGSEITFSSAVWADVDTLLPKTDLIELKPLLNRSAMEFDDSVKPQFGKPVWIAWEKLEESISGCLHPQTMYPERYLVTPFSDRPLFDQLQQIQIESPHDIFPSVTSSRAMRPLAAVGGEPPLQVLGGSRVALVVAAMAAIGLLILGGTGVALFLAARLLIQFGDATRLPVANVPHSVPIQVPGERQVGPNRVGVAHGRGRFAPLPPLAELSSAAQTIALLPVAEPELVWSPQETELQADFRNEAPPGAWLVGVRAVSGDDWGGVLRAVQPIYQQKDEYHLDKYIGLPGGRRQTQLLAREGYAVSSIRFQRGLVVNSLQLTWSRVVDTHFDLTDSYDSEWFGFVDNREQHVISASGFPVVGLAGQYDNGCFGGIALLKPALATDDQDRRTVTPKWSMVGDFPTLPGAESELPRVEAASHKLNDSSISRGEADLLTSEAPEGAWLVGARVTTGTEWGGVLNSVQPIFQLGDHYELGEHFGAEEGERQTQVIAPSGYAIAKIELQRGLVVNAIRFTFARVSQNHFDMTDSYVTSWLGLADGRSSEVQISTGPVTGLAYSFDGRCFADLRLRIAELERIGPSDPQSTD